MTDADSMYRQSPPRSADSARWCDLCNGWTDHHTDRHKPEDEASPGEVQAALAEARRQIAKKGKPA